MDSNRWDKLNDLFQTAQVLKGDERQAFIAKACGSDFELRRELNRLLAYHECPADTRLDAPVGLLDLNDNAVVHDDPLIGKQVSHFRIERLLGHGGFGDVYLATRTADFAHKVAIKVLHAGYRVNETIMRRFEIERQLLADLNHENIARLLDGGTTHDGRPYIVMEYVSGQNINKFCRTHKLSLRQRLEIFARALGGVAYAHQYGVIHRDIKPANILVDRDGSPKLVDFGIAKLTDLRSQAETLTLTRQGLLPLTPQYASPEQFTCEPVSPASDVYSLGVVLYELVTGSLPYEIPKSGVSGMVDVVSTQIPLEPTEQLKRNRLHAIAEAHESAAAGATDRRLPPSNHDQSSNLATADLDKVVLMTLRKEPERRYVDAGALGDDICRLLSGEAVSARGDSMGYQFQKFVQKNRVTLVAAAVVACSLIAGGLTAGMAWRSALQERQLATASQSLVQQHEHAAQIERAFLAFQRTDYRAVREILIGAAGDVFRDSLECRLLDKLSAPSVPLTLKHELGSVNEITVVPGKPWAVSVGEDRQILLWNTTNGQMVRKLGESKGPLHSVAVSADGTLLAVGREEKEDAKTEIELWDLTSFQLLRVVHRCWYVPESLAFSPDAKQLAIGTRYHDMFLVNLAAGADEKDEVVAAVDKDARYWNLAFLPDGSLVAPVQEKFDDGSNLEYLSVFDSRLNEIDRFTPDLGFSRAPVNIFALANSGELLAAVSERRPALILYEPTTRRQLASVPTGGDRSSAVAIAPGEDFLAVGFFDGTVRVWEVVASTHRDGQRDYKLSPCFHFQADREKVTSLWFTDEGQLVSSGNEPNVKVWPVPNCPAVQDVGPPVTGSLTQLEISNDNNRLVAAAIGGSIWVRTQSGDWVQPVGRDEDIRGSVAIGPYGTQLALRVRDDLCVVDIETQRQTILPFRGQGNINGTAYSPDGTRLAAIASDALLSVFDSGTQRENFSRELDSVPICVTFSADGKTAICGGVSGAIHLVDTKTTETRSLSSTSSEVTTLACANDGALLASGHFNGEIWLHQLSADTEPVLLSAHVGPVTGLVFSRDQETLLSGGADGTVRVWQVATSRLLGELYNGHPVMGLQPSADGQRIYLALGGVQGKKSIRMLQL